MTIANLRHYFAMIMALSVLTLAGTGRAYAQFFSLGDDPSGTRWSVLETPDYDIIFPSGMDSLAREYGYALEKYRPLSLAGIGIPIKRMPVVLHPFSATDNGMVMWAPRRMELLTTPSATAPSTTPWHNHLAVHESRHIGHINTFANDAFKPFAYILGEQAAGAFFGLFQNTYQYEGDAVIAETAYTSGGRGREADFLNYYMVAFDNGDIRNRDRWIVGSYRYYTPDNYAYGYLLHSANIYRSTDIGYYRDILETIRKRPYIPWVNDYAWKKVTGMTKTQAHRLAFATYDSLFRAQKLMRNPVTGTVPLTKIPSKHTEYRKGSVGNDGKLYFVKHSLDRPHMLVSIDIRSGKEKTIMPFSPYTSRLYSSPSGGRLYWSEPRVHPRWSLKEWSEIRYYDPSSGKSGKLTSRTRLWNAAVSSDGSMIASSEYLENGRYSTVILDSQTGLKVSRKAMPKGIRFTEMAWGAECLFALGISSQGMGIYTIAWDKDGSLCGEWQAVYGPHSENLTNLNADGFRITFASDADGVTNMYSLNLLSGKLSQIVSTPYGGDSYIVSDSLAYCSVLTHKGYLPHIAFTKSMDVPQGDFYPIADSLSALAEKYVTKEAFSFENDSSAFTVRKYSKALHIFNLHSWAPFYYDVDKLRTLSYDNITNAASLGMKVYSQNVLGTAESSLGYFFRNGRHGGNFNFTYSGLFHVFELEAEYNSRGYRTTSINKTSISSPFKVTESSDRWRGALASASINAYVPLTFNGKGIYSGLIPLVSYSINNDKYHFRTKTDGKIREDSYRYTSTLSTSLRYYMITATARAGIYPRWGFGVETGYMTTPNIHTYISDKLYVYAYAYFPSLVNHGIRVSFLHARDINSKMLSFTMNTLIPRGFTGVWAESFSPSQGTALTFDYAAPIHLGDISIPGTLYFKRAIVTPFADVTFMHNKGRYGLSAGSDIEFEIHVFNMPYPFRIGTRLAYNHTNFGTQDNFPAQGAFTAGFLFSVVFG